MSNQKDSFDSVREILRKLDRSITDAREKRLHPGESEKERGTSEPPSREPGAENTGENSGPPKVGRARPLYNRGNGSTT